MTKRQQQLLRKVRRLYRGLCREYGVDPLKGLRPPK